MGTIQTVGPSSRLGGEKDGAPGVGHPARAFLVCPATIQAVLSITIGIRFRLVHMEDAIRGAVHSVDQDTASQAILEIDARVQASDDSAEKAELMLNKAVFFGVLRRFDEALVELARVLGVAPSDPDIRLQHDYIHALLYYEQGNFQEALCQLNELEIRHPEQLRDSRFRLIYEDVQQRRAFALFRLRRFEDAVAVSKQCLMFDLSPKDRAVLLAHVLARVFTAVISLTNMFA